MELCSSFITKPCLFKYTENFTPKKWKKKKKKKKKKKNKKDKKILIFFIFEIWKNMYTPVNPSFTI